MEEEKSIFDQPYQNMNLQQPLPNATTVLVLGILSIVICFVGAILGIIALVLANKDQKLYNTGISQYTSVSFSNLKSGKICAIIGLILNGGLSLLYIIIIIFALTNASSRYF